MKNLLVITPHFKYFIKDTVEKSIYYFNNIYIFIPLPYYSFIINKINVFNKYLNYYHKLIENSYCKCNILYSKYITFIKNSELINLKLANKSSLNTINKLNLNFDLIHAHFLSYGYIGSHLKLNYGKPLVVTLHGHDAYDTPFRKEWCKVARFVLSNSDAIITPSEFNAKKLVNFGVSHNKINVIPNGYDENLFYYIPFEKARNMLRLPLNIKILVSIASLVPAKGYEYLIEAMKIVVKQHEDVILIICGNGPLMKKLVKMIDKLKLKEKIFIIGRRPHYEIPLWLNASNAFVLSSVKEGFPTVIPEAMACGKPVIATKVGGIPEAISEPSLGMLVDSKNPEALAFGIIEAIQKKWDPEPIIIHAKKYSYSNIIRHIINIYQRVLKNET
ncbi:MAG: glycosyltransferase [Candidatus Aenigmatarchaeota archaeon]